MKILLSAYACEPNVGSEPGVGWNWALELARRGEQVWVLTRANNQTAIEAELEKLAPLPHLHFLYYDLPTWLKCWKKGGRGIQLYYMLWQWRAFQWARKIHQQEKFDLVHHVTFSSIRTPSFMGNLGIPYIFGPVGGGNSAPWKLRHGYGLRGWILDAVRDGVNIVFTRFSPIQQGIFRKAQHLYVTSEETRSLIPKRYWAKTHIQLEIGCDKNFVEAGRQAFAQKDWSLDTFRILYVGRFLYLKGMHLGIPAFAQLLKSCPQARLTLVGKGPEEKQWFQFIKKYGLANQVDWHPWLSREALKGLYASHDVFYFPSLRDNSGNVVLEAMCYGLPVVCFDLGGPKTMVNNNCGRVVVTKNMNEKAVINGLATALQELAQDRELRKRLAEGALDRTKVFDWEYLAKTIYEKVSL